MTSDTEIKAGEITLLELVAVIAEAWKWFLNIPVAAALAVYLIIGQLASDYRSTTILRIEEPAALLRSPTVLRATIQELDIHDELDSTMDDAIEMLSRRISIDTIAPRITQVSLVGENAERTQATLATIIKNFALQITPRGQEREEIERQIAANRTTAEQMRQYAQTLTSDGQTSEAATRGSIDAALGYVALVNGILTREDNIIVLQRSLEGLSKDDILQEPTLPEGAKASNKLVFSPLAAIATGLGVLFVVLVGALVRRAPNVPLALSVPIRLTPIPTTCRVLPLSRI